MRQRTRSVHRTHRIYIECWYGSGQPMFRMSFRNAEKKYINKEDNNCCRLQPCISKYLQAHNSAAVVYVDNHKMAQANSYWRRNISSITAHTHRHFE